MPPSDATGSVKATLTRQLKPIVAFCAGTVVVLAVAVAVAAHTLMGSYQQLENAATSQKAEQVYRAFEADLRQLQISNRDYAEWDDAEQFTRDLDPGFLSTQLPCRHAARHARGLAVDHRRGGPGPLLEPRRSREHHRDLPCPARVPRRIAAVPDHRPHDAQPPARRPDREDRAGACRILDHRDHALRWHRQDRRRDDVRALHRSRGDRARARDESASGHDDLARRRRRTAPAGRRAGWRTRAVTRISSTPSTPSRSRATRCFAIPAAHRSPYSPRSSRATFVRWAQAPRWYLLSSIVVLFVAFGATASGLVLRLVMVQKRAFDDQRRAEDQQRANRRTIAKQAQRDSLTGLANRLFVHTRLPRVLTKMADTHRRLALIYIDLDFFKNINDARGHGCGDEVLRVVAKRLRMTVSQSRSRRAHGRRRVRDRELADAGHGDHRATSRSACRAAVAAEFVVDNTPMSVTASLGVAVYPDDGADTETLLKRAAIALNQAKEAGRRCHRFFAADMDARVTEHAVLQQALQKGDRHAADLHGLPADHRPHRRSRGVARGARALAPSGARADSADAVHPRGGEERPHRRDRRACTPRGANAATRVARRRCARGTDRGERVAATGRTRGLRGAREASDGRDRRRRRSGCASRSPSLR